MEIKFIDLFAGIGGFRYGLENIEKGGKPKQVGNRRQSTNIKRNGENEQRAKSFECVYSNEWDKYANSVYRRHYEECDNRDIRTVKASEISDFDLLCGGFPCQSFSIAGKRRGFDDTRGTLFFDIARILREKRPRLCLLENVKGLLSHDEGRTIKTIFATLTELGYDLQWQVLNSKDFGVPQNRERIFIIGHLRGTPRPEVFPIAGNNEKAPFGPITGAIGRARSSGSSYVGEVRADKSDTQENGSKPYDTDISGGAAYTNAIRRLTPVECERLQGFPDNWTQYGADGELISDTQRYKMCGNAVTTNVITEIAKRLV